MTIRFYGIKNEHRCFSNFSHHPFKLDGKTWPTIEHYFQAAKFPGHEHAECIRRVDSPMQAKRLGRSRKVPIRPDWEHVKDDVMRRAVLAKFTAHADIRHELLATGDEELIENASRDYYWGCGSRGDGKNMLGNILMELRARLREDT